MQKIAKNQRYFQIAPVQYYGNTSKTRKKVFFLVPKERYPRKRLARYK